MGAGRFGPVFLAHEPGTGEPVVVRTFTADLGPDDRAALAASLRRLCETPLEHPSIARPLTSGVEGDTPYLVHAYLTGTPLDAYLAANGPQPLSDLATRVTQLAAAIDFAAAAGVHHGILEPHDIILDEDRSGITGVGLAQAVSMAGIVLEADGPYASPQRQRGEPPTHADDVYALAALTAELVDADEEIPALRRAITEAVSENPADRPASALAFAAAVQRAVAGAERAVPDSRMRERIAPAPMPLFDDLPLREPDDHAPETAASEPERPPLRVMAFHAPADPDLPVEPADAEIDIDRFVAPADTPVAPDVQVRPDERYMEADVPAQLAESPVEADLHARLADAPAGPGIPAAAPDTRNDPLPVAVPVARDRRSFAFPVAAALAIGLLTGFAGGFVVGQRDEVPVIDERDSSGAPDVAPGSTYTDAPVGDAGRPAPPAPQPVAEPAVIPEGDAPVARPPAPTPRTAPRAADRTPPAAPRAAARTAPAAAATQRAALEIVSRPAGAEVFIDGTRVGRTPMSLADVRPGAHTVRLALPEHRLWVTSVELAPGERRRVAASLEP